MDFEEKNDHRQEQEVFRRNIAVFTYRSNIHNIQQQKLRVKQSTEESEKLVNWK